MKVAVVGAGNSGISCLNSLEKREDLKVYLIEKNIPSFRKELLSDWLIDKVFDSRFFIPLEELKDNFSFLELIHDKAIRINFEKRKIFFKEKEPLDFDKIILCCGRKPKKMDFDGALRQGVYYLASSWPPDLKKNIRVFSHVIVYVETILGIELAIKLASLSDKEIKVVAGSLNFVPEAYRDRVSGVLKDRGIDLYQDCGISEALGESRLKALKLSNGKFLACDILVLDTELLPNLDIVKDNPALLDENSLKINDNLNSVYDFCFSAGGILESKGSIYNFSADRKDSALKQAQVVAGNIFGAGRTFSFPEEKFEEEVLNNILEAK